MQDNGRGPPGGDGTAFARRVTGILRGLARPGTYLGAAREIAHGSFQLAAYPFGMVPMPPARNAGYRPPRLRETSLLATDPGMTCTPVVLVHGYVHNRSAFLVMQGALRRAGFQYVHAFNYLPLAYDLLELATLLAGEVERILATWGAQRCMIVGHSMGGMIARTYVQELGGEDTVDTVVTLGSPHRGTYTARLCVLAPAARRRATLGSALGSLLLGPRRGSRPSGEREARACRPASSERARRRHRSHVAAPDRRGPARCRPVSRQPSPRPTGVVARRQRPPHSCPASTPPRRGRG
jgi:pimeloyl-ACP methyl ester carboxylesterase